MSDSALEHAFGAPHLSLSKARGATARGGATTDPMINRYAQLHFEDLSAFALVSGADSASETLPNGLRFLTRRRDQKLGLLVAEPLDGPTARALDHRVFGLAGGGALLTSIERGCLPTGVETFAIRAASVDDLDALAASPALAKIEGLAVLDGAPRTDALVRLLASDVLALRSLSIFDATETLVRSLSERVLSRLTELRIVGPARRGKSILLDDSQVFARDRRTIETLDLAMLELSAPQLDAWRAGDWSGLQRLRVHGCAAPTNALGPFVALRELRSTSASWLSSSSLSDEAVASIVERSPDLEIVSLEGSAAGDQSAVALAAHAVHLQYLNFDKSFITSAGAIALARSPALNRLEVVALDARLSFDAAQALADSAVEAMRSVAHSPYRGFATVDYWAPPTPPPETSAAPAIQRTFRWQRYQECPQCQGIGAHDCPWHDPLVIHPMARGVEPPTESSRAWVAAHGALMTRVEQLGQEMLETMRAWGKYAGPARVTWWVLDQEHRGCDLAPFAAPLGMDAIIDAVGRPRFSSSASWAHACAWARSKEFSALPDPYTPARTIADLGASIVGLDAEDGLLIALRAE